MSKDYYDVLGVSKDASKEEIKKKYKQLVKKYHPDLNKDANAEDEFKKINEAGSVLLNDEKRAQYDQFGTVGSDAGFNTEGFSEYASHFSNINFDDIFDMFSDFGFSSRRKRRSQSFSKDGEDLLYSLKITLEEAYFGVKKDISFERFKTCSKCNGLGAESKSDVVTCETCGGKGVVMRTQRSVFGTFSTQTICPTCGGKGKSIKNPCSACDGKGRVREKKTLEVTIPKGVEEGMRLKLSGQGNCGENGGQYGDLYVEISVKPHDLFVRDGENVYLEIFLTYPQLVLGDSFEIVTLDGKTNIDIPQGTNVGDEIRLKKKGFKNLHTSRTGDQIVKVNLEIPKKITKVEKELLLKLKDEEKKKKKPGFFKKIFN
jgi:molecular chaperone DnaJ